MNICPCCKRRIVERSNGNDGRKKLAADMKKALAAIDALQHALLWPNETEVFKDAVTLEIERLYSAMQQTSKLWRIYRRADKASGYGVEDVLPSQTADLEAA